MKIDEIIHRIGYFRNRKNLSARELSLMIDKNKSYINHLEGKEFNIMLYALLEILEVLEVSCEEFFAENYTEYKQDKTVL